jgi:hypothetical protein
LEDIWKAAIVVPLSFRTTNHLGLLDVALNTIKQLGPLWGILCPALLSPLVLWIAFRENKRGQQQRRIDFQIMAWLFLWASAGLCGVLLQRHGHPHYMHPTIIPLITLSFYIVHLLKHFLGRPPLVLMALLWLGLALHFSRYFILRQFVQVYRIQEYEDQYQPYRDLGAWVQDNLDPDHTFCYWSMGYTPYLQAKKLCPTLVTPSFVEFGDTGAEWVGRDLVSMMKRDDISHLIENPETFPRNIANPLAYPEGSKSRQVIMAYSQWKLEKFRRVQHDIAPFKIFERR